MLNSVGAYHIEGLGIHLFSEIKGDYFTILGLPVLPVLEELRAALNYLRVGGPHEARLCHRLAGLALPIARDPRLLAGGTRA